MVDATSNKSFCQIHPNSRGFKLKLKLNFKGKTNLKGKPIFKGKTILWNTAEGSQNWALNCTGWGCRMLGIELNNWPNRTHLWPVWPVTPFPVRLSVSPPGSVLLWMLIISTMGITHFMPARNWERKVEGGRTGPLSKRKITALCSWGPCFTQWVWTDNCNCQHVGFDGQKNKLTRTYTKTVHPACKIHRL